jgi:hypothetical protein
MIPKMYRVFLLVAFVFLFLACQSSTDMAIETYKVGDIYFVEDGHHRISVARYLSWSVIQAHVTEIPLDFLSEVEFYERLQGSEAMSLRN